MWCVENTQIMVQIMRAHSYMYAHSHTHPLPTSIFSVIVRLGNSSHSPIVTVVCSAFGINKVVNYTSANVLLVLSLCVVPTVLSASASPYKQHTVLDVTVTLEPRPLCKLTRFLFGRSYCLLDVDLSAVSFFALHKYLLTNQPLPTTVEAIYLQRTNRTPNPRPSARAHAHIARVLLLCRVLGRG